MSTPAGREVATGSFERADQGLRRTMGLNSILFLSIGAIIGSGWLLGALDSASVAGPAAILSWVIGGILILFISLSYAELSGMLPRSGAIARYPQLTHGAYTGWMIGWTYWLSAISVPAIEAEAVVTYVGGTYPGSHLERVAHGVTVLTGPGIAFAVGLMVFFFLLNVFGIRLLGEWNRWFTWWKLVIPVATFCFLFVAFRGKSFHAYGGFFATGPANLFVAMSTTGVIFSYLGFRQALAYGGESRNPRRDVPLSTILSVGITTVIYALLEVGFVGALHWHAAGIHAGAWGALTASKWAGTPLYSALQAAGIGALLTFSNFLLVDAGLSPSGTGWIYMGTAARTNYALGVAGYGPRGLQRHNRWGIPWISLIVAVVLGCLFFIPAPSWYELVSFITSTTVLTYIMGGLGIPIFRRHAPDLPRPFWLPAARFFAPLGYLAATLLVFWSTYKTLTNVYAAVFFGLPLFGWYYAAKRGWTRPVPVAVLGMVFWGGWGYLQYRGGWVLRVHVPARGAWGFGTYDIALSAAVLFYCIGLWLLCNPEGRRHVTSTWWFVFLLLALFPVEHYTSAVGAHTSEPLAFGWGTAIAAGIGLVTYYWGVASGFMTDQLRDIVESQRAAEAPGVAQR